MLFSNTTLFVATSVGICITVRVPYFGDRPQLESRKSDSNATHSVRSAITNRKNRTISSNSKNLEVPDEESVYSDRSHKSDQGLGFNKSVRTRRQFYKNLRTFSLPYGNIGPTRQLIVLPEQNVLVTAGDGFENYADSLMGKKDDEHDMSEISKCHLMFWNAECKD